MRVTDIADEMKIKVFSATRLVDQLEGRGLVKRGRDKNDGRIIQVSITAKGKRMAQEKELRLKKRLKLMQTLSISDRSPGKS